MTTSYKELILWLTISDETFLYCFCALIFPSWHLNSIFSNKIPMTDTLLIDFNFFSWLGFGHFLVFSKLRIQSSFHVFFKSYSLWNYRKIPNGLKKNWKRNMLNILWQEGSTQFALRKWDQSSEIQSICILK